MGTHDFFPKVISVTMTLYGLFYPGNDISVYLN